MKRTIIEITEEGAMCIDENKRQTVTWCQPKNCSFCLKFYQKREKVGGRIITSVECGYDPEVHRRTDSHEGHAYRDYEGEEDEMR